MLRNSWTLPVKLFRSACHRTLFMITLVQVMVWCHRATSHYLNQRWPNFQTHIYIYSYLEHFLRPHWWLVNTGSGDILVLSGKKPLPQPMLTSSLMPHGITWPQVWVRDWLFQPYIPWNAHWTLAFSCFFTWKHSFHFLNMWKYTTMTSCWLPEPIIPLHSIW